MGTWGPAILSDDFARDVYDCYLRAYNAGAERDQIAAELLAANVHALKDPDDGPVFWLALAKAEWDTGAVDPEVLVRVEQLVATGQGMARWVDVGGRHLARRKAVLAEFAERIRVPNPTPRNRKQPQIQTAPFRPGTCLAILLADGEYGAAVVLAAREGLDSYGSNLVGSLRYKSAARPDAQSFEEREWLELTHHAHRGDPWITWCVKPGFRKVRNLFQATGQTSLRPSDPQDSYSYCRWELVPDQIARQFEWEFTGRK